jgi:hypothetical protein
MKSSRGSLIHDGAFARFMLFLNAADAEQEQEIQQNGARVSSCIKLQ